jgi:hypothetical protein
MRLGFAFSRVLGKFFLTLFFIFLITPLGWLVRPTGKNLLELKRPAKAESYWHTAKTPGSLDRMI